MRRKRLIGTSAALITVASGVALLQLSGVPQTAAIPPAHTEVPIPSPSQEWKPSSQIESERRQAAAEEHAAYVEAQRLAAEEAARQEAARQAEAARQEKERQREAAAAAEKKAQDTPAPTKAPTKTTAPAPAPAVPKSSSGDDATRLCIMRKESGGNYRAVSPSGTYHGAYQFSRPTGDATAKRMGRPDLVGTPVSQWSPADQDQAFWTLWAGGAGRSNWPTARGC